MIRGLLKINWLGIDVALGAGVLSVALAHSWSVPFQWSPYALLVIIVWLIYALDHLRDAHVHRDRIETERRKFHANYSRLLTLVAVGMLLTLIPLLLVQTRRLLLYGSILSVFVAMYFLLIQLGILKRAKEFAAAFFYTLGICLVPMTMKELPIEFLIHGGQIFLIALANLLLFSWFDFDADKAEGFEGLISEAAMSKRLIIVLLVIQAVVSAVLLVNGFHPALEGCLLLMSLLLLLPCAHSAYWARAQRFRILGDGIFFLPLISILYG
jgi:hypothetical protein